MNVVGKVGSLISQGVYSVATPFHPFGGAVDIIVVKQQDGSFRSTPWYVRFGKFQGVLKGAEKIVRVTVNGVEANFHMYLDNSGEAYFVREVDSGRGSMQESSSDVNSNKVEIPRLEHSISDSMVAQWREECDQSDPGQIGRLESDSGRFYYDFEDEQSSLASSEYGSNRYESLDEKQSGEPQGSSSEVVLVSVDGHVLTAPISALEKDAELLQLDTPRFHLGPGEGSGELNLDENAWAADYIKKFNASTRSKSPDNNDSMNGDGNRIPQRQEDPKGEENHASQMQKNQHQLEKDSDIQVHGDSEDAALNREDLFKSCLELPELARQIQGNNSEETNDTSVMQSLPMESIGTSKGRDDVDFGSNDIPSVLSGPVSQSNGVTLDIEIDAQKSPEKSKDWKPGKTEDQVSKELEDIDKNCPLSDSVFQDGNMSSDFKADVVPALDTALNTDHMDPKNVYMNGGPEGKVEEEGALVSDVGIGSSLQGPELVNECSEREPQLTASSEGIQPHTSTMFELSLCGDELHAGMGLEAASDVFDAFRISTEDFRNSAHAIVKNKNLVVRYREKYLPWDKAAPIVLGMVAFGLDLPFEKEDTIPVEQEKITTAEDDASKGGDDSSGRRWWLWPIAFRRVKTLEHAGSSSSNEELLVESESSSQNAHVDSTITSRNGGAAPQKQFIRTNVPTSEEIASLNLQEGQNVVTFSFSTRVLGTQQVEAHIYLWKWNTRIVISDVDGTITKSDVLGQFMPLVGRDWTQSGVAKLFSAIKENGYQLLFLSARAIVQAYLTRSFLLNVKQDGKALPNGPVVISPDGLFPSLYREVIRRAPHEFKIACLEDIRRLFPPDYNPFYAGFGNRDTDELSYRKIGIPKGKIFIINPKGEVAISQHRIDVKSYTSLHTLVNDMFPPTSLVEQEDFNSWNYWKMPLPDIEC